MKKIFLALIVCIGISAATPLHAKIGTTMLPSGYDRLEWCSEDGSRTIIYTDENGDVVQCIVVDKDNKVTFLWP
jgi:hypothetical protein